MQNIDRLSNIEKKNQIEMLTLQKCVSQWQPPTNCVFFSLKTKKMVKRMQKKCVRLFPGKFSICLKKKNNFEFKQNKKKLLRI